MINVTPELLQSFEALKEVPLEQLKWLIDNSEQRILPDGEFLFQPGQPINATNIFISGRVSMYMMQNNETREMAVFEAQTVSGYLPFSRAKTAPSFAKAAEDTQLLSFPAAKMHEMIADHFELTQALVHVMASRIRDFTALQQQSEKMMALGKLSAGLAHELNNPASAIVRGAASLKQHLLHAPKTFKDIIEMKMTADQVTIVNDMLIAVLNEKEKRILTLMERSELEDEMTDWMDAHEVNNAQEIAENFVEFGLKVSDAEAFKQHIPTEYISQVMNWINSNMVTEKMVTDIEEASRRITDLVGSVKNFTHMDQGHDKQYADIHSGIRNTLTMLHHKIHKNNIEVVEHFDTTLPPVKAMIGELNQVWTNLMDNALDAMEETGKGVLEIKTLKDGAFVEVSIIDNGPGIPEDYRSQIFDPFFTTKEIGKGTGLGLDVVSRIVKQHRGSIKVQSVPGRTAFIVCFPIDG
ncbi:ATP-binding protein [Mucilaginibacter sp. L196]|uniref:ATP-binding protein n=1 Tax=Mucilaginibacter sp. L196 TaxID=1641870 RepID=UPI00131E423C|nr:ATP-binding protein [Mucilaginibacter sp. L196]